VDCVCCNSTRRTTIKMRKRILFLTLIIAIITISLIFIVLFLKYKTKNNFIIPETTGGTLEVQDIDDVLQGESLNKLRILLPYREINYKFTIPIFSYSKGRFIVVFDDLNTINKEEVFSGWLKFSEFSSIPLSRFEIK